MTEPEEPTRWLDGGADAPEQFAQLLRADDANGPESVRLERVFDAVALQVARPELAHVLREQSPQLGHVASPSAASPLAGVSVSAAGKVLIGMFALFVGAVVCWRLVSQPGKPQLSMHRVPAAQALPKLAEASVTTPALAPSPVAEVVVAAPVSSPRAVPHASSKPPAARGTQVADPSAELALLERAQRALRETPERTLALTQQHRARFGHGQFEQEREMLAIEALLRLGRGTEAKQRARAFARSHPHSSHLPRLSDLLRAAP